jgi:alanyl-tRNA synthetase
MLPPTRRLDHGDPLLLDFDARVLDAGLHDGRPAVVLDASAFYPESGGQLADLGSLGGALVADVQVDDGGVVRHYLAEGSPVPAPGDVLAGRVDRTRRRLHMALHTGQHMLSRALLDEAGGETVSSRLGSSSCTIDLHLAAVDEAAVARAESLVNAVVDDDRVVRVFFPAPDELAALPLRRAPKVTENIRVVDVGGFDLSPCGGTHCTRTAQVVGVTVTGVERYKGKVRVTFLAGRLAWSELTSHSRSLVELGRSFSSKPLETKGAVERLRAELTSSREAHGATRARWAALHGDALANEALARGEGRVVSALEGVPLDTLRTLASAVTARGLVALLASRVDEGTVVTVARPDGSSFDCGAWLKRAAAAHGGRGGGKADRAEGRFPAAIDWAAVGASE